MAEDVKAASTVDTAKVEQEVSWVGARLREPSTYAGLGLLLTAIFHLSNATVLAGNIQTIGIGVGMVIGGVLAIILPEAKSKAVASLLALFVIAAALASPTPAFAQKPDKLGLRLAFNTPTKKSATASSTSSSSTSASGQLTVQQVQTNPLLLITQFTTADLQAALADANAQTPPDTAGAACYTALLAVVSSPAANPLPSQAGIFEALQKARDAQAMLANLQSPNGPLASINTACAPIIMNAQNTLIGLGVAAGLIANPTGAAAAAAGIPAAVATFLALPKL